MVVAYAGNHQRGAQNVMMCSSPPQEQHHFSSFLYVCPSPQTHYKFLDGLICGKSLINVCWVAMNTSDKDLLLLKFYPKGKIPGDQGVLCVDTGKRVFQSLGPTSARVKPHQNELREK